MALKVEVDEDSWSFFDVVDVFCSREVLCLLTWCVMKTNLKHLDLFCGTVDVVFVLDPFCVDFRLTKKVEQS